MRNIGLINLINAHVWPRISTANCFDLVRVLEAHKSQTDDRCWNSFGMSVSSCPLSHLLIYYSQLVEGCESRLAEDEVADLLQLVANLLWDEVDVCFMYNHKLRETQELHWLSLACARPEIFFVFNFKVFSRIIVNNLYDTFQVTKWSSRQRKSLP